MKDGNNLPFDAGYSMADFIRSREAAYRQYKKNKGVSEETVESYLKAIYTLTWLHTITDLKNREVITKPIKDAVYEVCAFLRDELEQSRDTFNGFAGSQYRKVVSDRYKPRRGVNASQKTKELIQYPEIITQTMELLPADVQLFFAITACCGARSAQLYRLYDSKLKIYPMPDKGFFRLDATEVGEGHKSATEYFFPMWMLPAVKGFRQLRGKGYKEPVKQYSDIVQDASRVVNENIPCNLSSLRKFAKAVLTKSKIDDAAAEYTQGRKPEGIGQKAYDNIRVKAIDVYPETLPFWEEYLPIPDWMKDPEQIKIRLDAVEAELTQPAPKQRIPSNPGSGRKQMSDEKRKEILTLHKEKFPQREIARRVGVARATVSAVINSK